MKIIVNGEPLEVASLSLAETLVELGYEDAIVATALNGEFVSARSRAQAPIKEGDEVEIVAPRQGG